MTEIAIRNLLKSQFEPFFHEEILPELVPEFFSLSYESLDGSKISIEIPVAIIRFIKGGGDFAEVASEYGYQNLNRRRFPEYLERNDTLVLVTPEYTRFSVEDPKKVLILELWFYKNGELTFAVVRQNANLDEDERFPIYEYREDWRDGKFRSVDVRAMATKARTYEDLETISIQYFWSIGGSRFDTPTRYLGSLVELMSMF